MSDVDPGVRKLMHALSMGRERLEERFMMAVVMRSRFGSG
jgi:hypothetical protein